VTDKLITVKVIECDTYSRCVGYYTLTKSWNSGKKGEWTDRKFVRLRKLPKEIHNEKETDKEDT